MGYTEVVEALPEDLEAVVLRRFDEMAAKQELHYAMPQHRIVRHQGFIVGKPACTHLSQRLQRNIFLVYCIPIIIH